MQAKLNKRYKFKYSIIYLSKNLVMCDQILDLAFLNILKYVFLTLFAEL